MKSIEKKGKATASVGMIDLINILKNSEYKDIVDVECCKQGKTFFTKRHQGRT